jgi:hypothetical protein
MHQGVFTMAAAPKARGIHVAIHLADSGCGNPCHPGHACAACEPFWQNMQATGRFRAYVPPTFAGDAPLPKMNFGAKKLDLGDVLLRMKGSNS